MFSDTESSWFKHQNFDQLLEIKAQNQVKRCYEIAAEENQPILKVSRIESYFKSKKESISEVIARLVSVDGLTWFIPRRFEGAPLIAIFDAL